MENSESGLEKITDTIESVITGIPAPLRKNFLKAFGQLCTAAVDVPEAWLEGKAHEIRATTEARVEIIKKEGQSFANKVDAPKEYVDKASLKFASKIIKEQLNLDEITYRAAQDLAKEGDKIDNSPKEEISDDWLNEFESQARLKSSDDMKLIFSKILSGEISKPGTFSIRTVKLISQLDNQPAKLFQLLCSHSVSLRVGKQVVDTRVVSLSGNAASNSLAPFGLAFSNLNILQEYGLIISDYNAFANYSKCIANNQPASLCFRFNNLDYVLDPIYGSVLNHSILNLHGVVFTKAGRELLDIIPIIPAERYQAALNQFFEKRELNMVEVNLNKNKKP